jgi:alpha-1,3-glucosyltransferase
VSNLWCALSVRPVSIRERLPQDIQPLVALFVTVLLIIPACYKIFSIGKRGNGNANDQRLVLWAMTSTGLGFFLASFQVHEKSLLMALAPISLLYWNDIALVQWFSVMSTWTLWPLVVVDRLEACYFCVILIFVSLCWQSEKSHDRQQDASIFHYNRLTRWLIAVMYAGMAMLHLLEALVVPPPNLPDLFPVLWSIGGCGMICVAWLTTCIHLYECRPSNTSATKVKVS